MRAARGNIGDRGQLMGLTGLKRGMSWKVYVIKVRFAPNPTELAWRGFESAIDISNCRLRHHFAIKRGAHGSFGGRGQSVGPIGFASGIG